MFLLKSGKFKHIFCHNSHKMSIFGTFSAKFRIIFEKLRHFSLKLRKFSKNWEIFSKTQTQKRKNWDLRNFSKIASFKTASKKPAMVSVHFYVRQARQGEARVFFSSSSSSSSFFSNYFPDISACHCMSSPIIASHDGLPIITRWWFADRHLMTVCRSWLDMMVSWSSQWRSRQHSETISKFSKFL